MTLHQAAGTGGRIRGKRQKELQPQAVEGAGPGVSRLDQIVEQIGHLDGASKFHGRREISELPMGQLERLGKLREQGILTEEEFALQKQQILEA